MAEDEYRPPQTPLAKSEARVKALESKLESLGVRGEAKLYYSLNKNMADLSDILDNTDMSEINLSDPKDKTMERLKTIWAAITPLAETLKFLKSTAGITGDEDKDTKRTFSDKLAVERP